MTLRERMERLRGKKYTLLENETVEDEGLTLFEQQQTLFEQQEPELSREREQEYERILADHSSSNKTPEQKWEKMLELDQKETELRFTHFAEEEIKKNDCQALTHLSSLEGRIIAIKGDCMKQGYANRETQLMYCRGESRNVSGSEKMYDCIALNTGERTVFRRSDILGIYKGKLKTWEADHLWNAEKGKDPWSSPVLIWARKTEGRPEAELSRKKEEAWLYQSYEQFEDFLRVLNKEKQVEQEQQQQRNIMGAWIGDHAQVCGNADIRDDAKICGTAMVDWGVVCDEVIGQHQEIERIPMREQIASAKAEAAHNTEPELERKDDEELEF